MFSHLKTFLSSTISSVFILALLIALFIPHSVYSEDSLEVPVIRVIDGDTFQTIISLPAPLHEVKIRIRNIDTPESTYRGRCIEEQLLGKEATKHLKLLLKDAKTVILTDFDWDKYGGRIDATVYYHGINIGQRMINDGYAVQYNGGKKPNWCSTPRR